MIFPWLPHRSESVCWTHTDLSAFVRSNLCKACSLTRRHGSSHWFGAQKNGLWHVRTHTPRLVRSHAAAGTRSLVRSVSDLSGVRGSAGVVPKLPSSEARAAFLAGRQCIAYQALRLLRGPA